MQSIVGLLLNLLQQVGAIDKILLRIQKCHSLPVDFLTLSATLRAALAICNILSHDLILQVSSSNRDSFHSSGSHSAAKEDSFGPRSIAFLNSILERCFLPVLQGLYERITSVVDEEMTSHVRDAVIIQSGFNEKLDTAKSAFESLSGKQRMSIRWAYQKASANVLLFAYEIFLQHLPKIHSLL